MRRLRFRKGTFALNRFHQCRGLSTDKRVKPLMHPEVDTEICTQNFITQETSFLGLFDGHIQSLDRNRIIRTGVDDPLRRANSISPDQQTFNHLMRVAFHDTAIHIGSGVALVPINHNITGSLFVGRGLGRLLPLVSSDKPAAAFAAQSGFFYLGDHPIRLHGSQNFFQGFITTHSDVFIDVFRINSTAMLQRNTGLHFQCIVIITIGTGLFTHLATHNMVIQNVFDHRGFNFLVGHPGFIGDINIHQYITATVAPAPDLAHFAFSLTKCGIGFHFRNLLLKFGINLITAFSNTTQAQAYGYFYLALFLSNSLALFFNGFHERSP